MAVVRPGEDPEVLHDPTPKRATRNHALDRLLDHPLGMPAVENGALAAPLDAARIAGMPIKDVVFALVAGQLHLFGIDDDDIVAAIHVRRIGGLVLAAQPDRDDRGKPAQHQAVGVDH